MTGVVTRSDIRRYVQEHPLGEKEHLNGGDDHGLRGLVKPNPATVFPDEPLRVAVYRMAETGITRLVVVERSNPHKLVGIVSLRDLLKARVRNLAEERDRERVLTMPQMLGLGSWRQ